MTEIDVPDWVVVLAGEEYVNHGGEYSRYAMERALTAALGAWVVPVGRLNDSSPTLFTLRQEKPE